MITASEFLKWLSIFKVPYGGGGTTSANVQAATTANFASTYNNGISGIGATLTASSVGAVTLDGIAVILGDNYLFKNQTADAQNGIYTCTTLGDVSTEAIFTRATNYNTPAQINATGIIAVLMGSTQGGTGWYEINTINTIGTDSISYLKFGNAGTVTEIDTGTGLTGGPITGSGTVSLDVPIPVDLGGTGIITTTPYSLIASGVTATGQFQQISPGAVNTVLQGGGAGALPQFLSSISLQGLQLSSLTANEAVVTDNVKNLVSMSYSSSSITSSNLMSRDMNGNTGANTFTTAVYPITTSATPIPLTIAYAGNLIFTGTIAQTVQMPDATTLEKGHLYRIYNDSSAIMTIQNFTSANLFTVPIGATVEIFPSDVSTTAGIWEYRWLLPANAQYGTSGLTVTGTFTTTGLLTFGTISDPNLQGLVNLGNALTGPVFLSGVNAGITTFHTPIGEAFGGTSFNNTTAGVSFGDQVNFTNTGTISLELQQGAYGVGYYFEGILSSTGTINITGFTGNTVYGPTTIVGGGTTASTVKFRCEIIAVGGGTAWFVSISPNSQVLDNLGTAAYKAASNNAYANLASVNTAGITTGEVPVFFDVNGTLITSGYPIGSASGLAVLDSAGHLLDTEFPALSGDIANAAGNVTTSLQPISITGKPAATAATMNDLFLINQSSILKQESLGQMFDTVLSQGSAPPTYSTTQTLVAPLPNFIVTNNVGGIVLTLPKLDGYVRYGQPFTFYNSGTGNVVVNNNAGTTLFIIPPGQICNSYISFIDTTGGGADILVYSQTLASSVANPNTLVFYTGDVLATIAGVTVNTSGAIGSINNTKQPLVVAYLSANIGSATGDGTHYTVPFDNVPVNNTSSYNSSNGVFTAPVAGNYLFVGQITFSNVQSGNTAGLLNFPFTNRTYQANACNLANVKDANNNCALAFSVINNMNAGDTVYVVAIASGSSKAVGINGSGSPLSYWGIYLLS